MEKVRKLTKGLKPDPPLALYVYKKGVESLRPLSLVFELLYEYPTINVKIDVGGFLTTPIV